MADDLNLTLADGLPVQPGGGPLRPSLIELAGGQFGRQFFLGPEPVTIGRSEDVELRVVDARASRRHTVIEPDSTAPPGPAPRYVIRDLGSRNGTYVNGQRIERAPLNDGDKIQVGYTIFKFALKDTVELAFEDKIYKLATTDPLTGLNARDYFFKEFAQVIAHCDRYERPLSVIMVDLDDFKAVNDTHGHIAGDRVLEAVAKLLAACLRGEDLAGRYGGEEFIALLPETPPEAARFPADRFREALAQLAIAVPDGPTLHVTASIGVAGMPEHGRTIEALVQAADQALYAAKGAGKNCVVIASEATSRLQVRPVTRDDPPATDGDADPFAG